MKMILLTVLALLASTTARADTTVQLPTPPPAMLTGGILCGQPPVTAVVTGFSADGLSVLGQVALRFSCQVGGRGARPKTYQFCQLIAWSLTSPESYQLFAAPCAVADPTLTYASGPYQAWTTGGAAWLAVP